MEWVIDFDWNTHVRRRLLDAKTLEPVVFSGAAGASHLRRRHGLGGVLQDADAMLPPVPACARRTSGAVHRTPATNIALA